RSVTHSASDPSAIHSCDVSRVPSGPQRTTTVVGATSSSSSHDRSCTCRVVSVMLDGADVLPGGKKTISWSGVASIVYPVMSSIFRNSSDTFMLLTENGCNVRPEEPGVYENPREVSASVMTSPI